ncbi:MAG: 3D domain-containing protein [Nevskiales bacterium]
MRTRHKLITLLLAIMASPAAWADTEHTLSVTAVAYTLDDDQTDDSEDIGAWGDELDDEARIIAVSRDLLEMGLKRGTRLRIHGRRGEYVVMDLMHPRWKKRIDILMEDDDDAFRWGRRKVKISWTGPAIEPVAKKHEKKIAPKTLTP